MLSYFTVILSALTFNQDIYSEPLALNGGLSLALSVLIGAGLANAAGQSVVLFANRVRPRRFLLSLVLASSFYVANYLLLSVSVWALASALFGLDTGLAQVLVVVGLAHAPYLLGVLGFAPYLGVGLSSLLSIWHGLLLLFGLGTAFELALWQTLLSAGLPWLSLQLAQRSLGRPLVQLRCWLQARAAGLESFREDALALIVTEQLLVGSDKGA